MLLVCFILFKFCFIHFSTRWLWWPSGIFVSRRSCPVLLTSTFIISWFWSFWPLFWFGPLIRWWSNFFRLWSFSIFISWSRSSFSLFFCFFYFWFSFKLTSKSANFRTWWVSISIVKSSFASLLFSLFIWLNNSNVFFFSIYHFQILFIENNSILLCLFFKSCSSLSFLLIPFSKLFLEINSHFISLLFFVKDVLNFFKFLRIFFSHSLNFIEIKWA